MRNLEFVHFSSAEFGGGDDAAPVASNADRRRIRSVVMRDFRRKERERRRTGYVANGTSAGLDSDDEVSPATHSTPSPTELPRLKLPSTAFAAPIWRHSLGSKMAEAWFPAGHRDSALRNIAYTYDMLSSGPIVSIQDSLSLLHAGSAARIDHLLLEARKRYVPVISLLRREVSKRTSEVPVVQLGFLAMACLMCETYTAIACKSGLITWQRQVLGISALVSPVQPSRFSLAMESFLFQQIRVAQLIHSLFDRRPFPSRLAIRALPAREDRLHSLLELAFQVPDILEAVDMAITGDSRTFCCVKGELATRLDTLEISLRSWLAAYSSSGTGRATIPIGLALHNAKTSASPVDSRNALFNLTCETLCRICHMFIVESQVRVDDQALRNVASYPSPIDCADALRRAMMSLQEAAGTPICKARVMSAPLHFLSDYYQRHEDDSGLQWCHKTKESLQSGAPYLHWEALLPWCLLTLNEIPHYDADPYA